VDRVSKNMKPTVYFVTPWFGTFAGGFESAFRLLERRVASCGYTTVVLTTNSESPYLDWWTRTVPTGESEFEGAKVLRFQVDTENRDLYHRTVARKIAGSEITLEDQRNFFRYGINSQQLISYCSGLPADAIILAGPYYQSLTVTLTLALPSRVVVMPAFHDEDEMHWEPIQNLVRSAKSLVFFSEEEKLLAIREFGTKVGRSLVESVVSGLGVELTPSVERCLANAEEVQATKSKHGIKGRYFVYVGRVDKGKGLQFLIEDFLSWKDLEEPGSSDVCLLIVGTGDMSFIPTSPSILATGFVSAEEKFSLLSGAVALINPSQNESFSFVIMEAWLLGVPVLVHEWCAVTKGHVDRSQGGLYFSNSKELAVELSMLLEETTAKALGEQGRAYVNRNFRWSVVVDKLIGAMN